jgi:hypothetical protein
MTTSPGKPYHEMTPAERLADRIAKNRAIDERAAASIKTDRRIAKPSRGPKTPTVLDKFQQIKRNDGIDAASEFVRSRTK